IENPEMDPQTYGQLIFNKAGKSIQGGKDHLFSKKCWENWTATWRRMKLDRFLTPYKKIFKMVKRSKCEIIKIQEEKTGSNLFDLSCSNFLRDNLQRQGKQKQK
ncbi:LORF2 protein, partial [Crocuta crocuta]